MRIKQKQNDYILKIYVEPKNSTPDKQNSLKNLKKITQKPHKPISANQKPQKPFWLGPKFCLPPKLGTSPHHPSPITPQPTLLIS
jgi:hypothetical protein